jgi:hypothetical protein
MYIHRHNKAGQLILRAVAEGRRGGEVIMMDVGRHNDTGSAAHLPSRIPLDALPSSIDAGIKRRLSRFSKPDIFMYMPRTASAGPTYTIVELKYCKDTDPTEQRDRAKTQHLELARALREAEGGAQVRYVTVMLGVSGTIFKLETLEQLKTLGITGRSLDKLKYAMHLLAVKQLHWIYTNKRRLEAAPSTRSGGHYRPSTGEAPQGSSMQRATSKRQRGTPQMGKHLKRRRHTDMLGRDRRKRMRESSDGSDPRGHVSKRSKPQPRKRRAITTPRREPSKRRKS